MIGMSSAGIYPCSHTHTHTHPSSRAAIPVAIPFATCHMPLATFISRFASACGKLQLGVRSGFLFFRSILEYHEARFVEAAGGVFGGRGLRLLLIMRLVLCYTFFTQRLFPHIAAMAASHGAARRGVIQRHVLTPPEIAHVWACPSGLCECAYECVCLSPLMSSATWPLLKQAGRTKNKLKGTRHKAQGSSQRGRGTLRAHSALKSFLCFHPGLLLFLASLYTLQAMR